jgi:hypothetical protein
MRSKRRGTALLCIARAMQECACSTPSQLSIQYQHPSRAAMEVPVLTPVPVSLSNTALKMLTPGANMSTQAPLEVTGRRTRSHMTYKPRC